MYINLHTMDMCTACCWGQGIAPESPEEEMLVTGGGDGRIVVWRTNPDRKGAITEFYTLEDGREEGESILSLAREGSFLYSGRFNGEVNVWDLETRQLVRSLKANTGDVLSLCVGRWPPLRWWGGRQRTGMLILALISDLPTEMI